MLEIIVKYITLVYFFAAKIGFYFVKGVSKLFVVGSKVPIASFFSNKSIVGFAKKIKLLYILRAFRPIKA